MTFENAQENIETFPSKEQILEVIKDHLGDLEFETTRELEDENGVYFLEIVTKEQDPDGYIREYTYSRKSVRTGEALEAKVFVGFFEDDIPVGGEDVCSFSS